MILTLEVVGPQAAALGDSSRKQFDDKGGTIGRSRENDWVIADSYVSGVHARIHYRNGRFFIVDSSANGTSLKTRANRLTKGQWYAIDDMDRLFLDTIEIRALIHSTANKDTVPLAVTPSPHPATEVMHPGAATGAPQMDNRMEDTPPSRTTPLSMPTDAVLAVLLGERDVSSFEREFLNTPLPDDMPDDEADDASARHSSSAAAHVPAHMSAPVPFERTTALPSAQAPAPSDDDVPRTIALNLTGHALAGMTGPTGMTASAPPSSSANATSVDAEFADVFDGTSTLVSGHAPGLLDTQMVKGLLAGVAIPTETVTPELAETLTHVLRHCIQGLLELQQQRDTMKDAFRLSVTKFKPAENNPLRFSANVEDALYNLLVKRNPAYLAPPEAVIASFRDAQAHDEAMVNALRVAFFQMMNHFDPQHFGGGKSGGFFSAKKDAGWDKFREHYAELRKQPDGGFSTLFGETFARAYQDELDRLKQSRPSP